MKRIWLAVAAATLTLGVAGIAAANPLVEDLSTFPQLAGMDTTSPGDHLAGSGRVTVPDEGPQSFEVGARSEPDGSNALGFIVTNQLHPLTGEPALFHGHVREGCLIVVGNQAVAVGRLPQSEQFNFGTRRITSVAVRVVDNGPPVNGQPVDLGIPILLFETTAERLCTGVAPITALFPPLPLESGNVVVHDTVVAP